MKITLDLSKVIALEVAKKTSHAEIEVGSAQYEVELTKALLENANEEITVQKDLACQAAEEATDLKAALAALVAKFYWTGVESVQAWPVGKIVQTADIIAANLTSTGKTNAVTIEDMLERLAGHEPEKAYRTFAFQTG